MQYSEKKKQYIADCIKESWVAYNAYLKEGGKLTRAEWLAKYEPHLIVMTNR